MEKDREVDIVVEIKRRMESNPILSIDDKTLYEVLLKNIHLGTKAIIGYQNFSIAGARSQAFTKLTKNMFAFPLYMDYYASKGTVDFALWRQKIEYPVRSTQCTHADVFDFEYYTKKIKEGKSECPICDQKITISSLYIDLRVYTALTHNQDACVAALPKPNIEGYDPELCYVYPVSYFSQSTTIFRIPGTFGDQKSGDKSIFNNNLQIEQNLKTEEKFVRGYILRPITYKINKKRAQFKLESCSVSTIVNNLSVLATTDTLD